MDLTARQEQFADAGLTLLARDGMAAVTFRTVAKEAGMSLGAVQKAFPTKDAMLVAMLHRMRIAAAAPNLAEPGRPTLVSWLTELTMAILPLDLASRTAQLQASAFGDRAPYDPELAAVLVAGNTELVQSITGLVRRAAAEEEVAAATDADAVARIWLDHTTGLASRLLYAPEQPSRVRDQVEVMLRSLLPRPAAD